MQMSSHAIQRFQERIEALSPEAIQAWADKLFDKRPKGEQRPLRIRRKRRKKKQTYIRARAPGGRPAYLALSEDEQIVLTVLDVGQWNQLAGSPASPETKQRERIMRKLQEERWAQ